MTLGHRPGSACLAGCRARLCPYPPPGEPRFRGELSEALCRDRRNLLSRPGSSTAPWWHGKRRELERFWKLMEHRARMEK